MFQPQVEGECFTGEMFNTKIWKYLPQLSVNDGFEKYVVFKLCFYLLFCV